MIISSNRGVWSTKNWGKSQAAMIWPAGQLIKVQTFFSWLLESFCTPAIAGGILSGNGLKLELLWRTAAL
jgi:hypothetical protein